MNLCACGCGIEVVGTWKRGHATRLKNPMFNQNENREKNNFCACGCGEKVSSKWARGHISRVENVSKRPEIKELRKEAMLKMHTNGVMPEPWNKGKTGEEDLRIKKYGKKQSENLTIEEKKI